MKKGVVMEVGERHAIVLTDTGAFVRLSKRGRAFVVGEEVSLPAARRGLPRRAWYALSSTAAAVFLALFLFSSLPGNGPPIATTPEDAAGPLATKVEGGGTTSPGTANDPPKPAAYVSIDINPSVELGLDADGMVLQASGRNEDAVELLEGLQLVGLPLEAAVGQVMEAAEAKLLSGKQEADIVITSVVVDEAAKIEEAELQARVRQEVDRVIREHHPEAVESFQVTVWSAPKEVLEEAEAAGLSAGKMTFLLKAQANGVDVTAEELQQSSIRDVAKRYEEKKLLDADPSWTKEAIKDLLKSQKSHSKSSDDDEENDDDRNVENNGSGGNDGNGNNGNNGNNGSKGNNGNKGNNGSSDGNNGNNGSNGSNGSNGNKGSNGSKGSNENTGNNGNASNGNKGKNDDKGKSGGKTDDVGIDLNLELEFDSRDDDTKDDGKDEDRSSSDPKSDRTSGGRNEDDRDDGGGRQEDDRDGTDDRNTSEGGPGRGDGSVSPRSEKPGGGSEGRQDEKSGNGDHAGNDDKEDKNKDEKGNEPKEEKKDKN